MTDAQEVFSPLEAYQAAEQQKRLIGEQFRAEILALRRTAQPPATADADAWKAFVASPSQDDNAVCQSYRDVAMRFGLSFIDPASPGFVAALNQFHRNYVTNFPIPSEQETLEGFEDLWRASPRAGGYQEVGYSLVCPLTGRYLMGLNFTIQPESDSVHFIYGFINAPARGIGGFSARMIDFMRTVAGRAIVTYLAAHPADWPSWHNPAGPLILFEKNIMEDMSLADILMDSAGVDIDNPPIVGADLSASAIGQSLRDMVWDRRGARIVDYSYMQSSLDGVVCVPESERFRVMDFLCHQPLGSDDQARAASILDASLDGRIEGCTALNLCAFTGADVLTVDAAQIRRSNEIFQGISVVKDPTHLDDDIYFQTQMADLARRTCQGKLALRHILPTGAQDFVQAEILTQRVLAGLSWEDLRTNRDRTYREWLESLAL